MQAQDVSDTSRLKIIFAGDIMGHDSQIASALDNNTYNYDTCFSQLKPYISTADIAIANLEVTLAGPPFRGYPAFSSPDELADAVKNAGFNVLITANNHSLDRMFAGVARTCSILENKGIIYTGTFNSEEDKELDYPLIIEKNDIRIALLNYTYGTNGIVVKESFAVNYIDTIHIKRDIAKARLAEPDYIILTIHWGSEYERAENRHQKKLAETILAMGADVIIGSHPHVVQPIRKYYTDPADSSNFNIVVYSLGNFISNQRDRYRNGGIIYEITLEKTDRVRIKDHSYLPVWVHKPMGKNNKNLFVLVPATPELIYNNQPAMEDEDKEQMMLFFEDTKSHLEEALPSLRIWKTSE
jgi:poly-gamma-glutamate synthesis protein (capsule biosynthesis protein)